MTASASRSATLPLRTGRFWGCLVLFTVGLILDTQTTIAIIEHPTFREANPVMVLVMAASGPTGILGVKLGFFAIAVGSFRLLFDDATYTWAVNLVLAGCGVAWSLAGLWNALLLA